MKKILGVVGSPRLQGNTHILVERILEGAEAGGVTTETLFLDDLSIRECIGCHACWQGTECTRRDDMNRVYPKIGESDVIVFGTPVYWYGPTALMKGFIDRFVYFNCPEHCEDIRGTLAVVACPFEEESREAAALLEAFFEKCFVYLGMECAGTILAPGVTLKGEVRKCEATLAEAYDIGKAVAARV